VCNTHITGDNEYEKKGTCERLYINEFIRRNGEGGIGERGL
jgi:hypothetical protein